MTSPIGARQHDLPTRRCRPSIRRLALGATNTTRTLLLVISVALASMLIGCESPFEMKVETRTIAQQIRPSGHFILETITRDAGATTSVVYDVRIRMNSDDTGVSSLLIWRSSRATFLRARWRGDNKVEISTDSKDVVVWIQKGLLFREELTVIRSQAPVSPNSK